jgi:enamine deaminase RidA (YjgF/YER057c/UK114 family)
MLIIICSVFSSVSNRSGQVGFVDSGGKEVKGIKAQTRQCLGNIKLVLAAAGSSLNDVAKLTVHAWVKLNRPDLLV